MVPPETGRLQAKAGCSIYLKLMDIQQNVPLKKHSTMRLGGDAAYYAEIQSPEDLSQLAAWARANHQPIVMIGDGSNIIWKDEGFHGLVLANKILGFEERPTSGGTDTLFTFGAGENWDDVVRRTVEMGYSGLEQLSLIPGTAGATPVQNVGAYGHEIKDVLVSVRVYDKTTDVLRTLKGEECGFGYRTSRFKTTDKERFFIVSITVKLNKSNPTPPFYNSLQLYLDEHNITEYTPQIIRDAVIAIRSSKLPDPSEVANNGSFFANPIISKAEFLRVMRDYPEIPNWPTSNDRLKLSAAWMIEQAGFPKGFQDNETGMGLWPKQALVFVNEHAENTSDLLTFKNKIVSKVEEKFGVTLEQEPEIL